MDAGLEFAELNIGGLRKTVKGMDLGDAVTLAGDDSESLKELRRRGVKGEIRPMPADRPVPLPEGVG